MQRPGTERSPVELAAFLDGVLHADRFRVEEPENGLLLDTGRPVRRLGAAVNTSFQAIRAAGDEGVDLLLVHHASWPSIDLHLHERKMGMLRDLGISLYGAHASLDAAPGIGTSDALARLIGLPVEARFAEYLGGEAGVRGHWEGTLDSLVGAVRGAIGTDPEVHANTRGCGTVGIVAGAGGLTSWIDQARQLGCDTYLTGEGSMYTRLFAREAGINLLLGGHYRTEAPGIRALTEYVADHFRLAWSFLEDVAAG